MPTATFAHGFAFDPTYGYTLETLLQLPPPPEPADFAAFWQGLFAQAQTVQVAPQLQEIASPVPEATPIYGRIYVFRQFPHQRLVDRSEG